MWTRRSGSILNIYNLLLGAFLFVSPWLFAFAHGAAGIDAQLAGAAIAVVSIGALLVFAEWEEWIVIATGIWLVLSPFALRFEHTTAMHITIGVGLALCYLAALDLWLIHYGSERIG
jgi:hypothetical protein